MNSDDMLGSSFRDPSGFVFKRDGIIYRQINKSYRAEYDKLMSSGLYTKLVEKKKLIAHSEVHVSGFGNEYNLYKIIQPETVNFISYPYDWSFTQLKDAALLTLDLAREALNYNMILKDASAYNIQFHLGKPVLVDTLSFDLFVENKPWSAYRQFCQHFLVPLALASLVDIRLVQLLKSYIDGIPLDLASKLLPWKSRLDIFGFGVTIHAHSKLQKKYSYRKNNFDNRKVRINKDQQRIIIEGYSIFVKMFRL